MKIREDAWIPPPRITSRRVISTLKERPTAAAVALFAILAAAFLNKALLPGYTLLPLDLIQTIVPWDNLELGPLANRLVSDPFYYFYPFRHYATESIQAGHFPLWNPLILSGTPTVADPTFQLFYPPTILASLFLPVRHALPWLAWFHLATTGTFMYLFLRRFGLGWPAAVLGGGAWMLNGYNLVWLENPHRLSTLTWIPGVFFAYEAATQDKKAGWVALGGLLLGLAILGGQMQFIFAFGLMLGLYGALKIALDLRNRGWNTVRLALYLILIGIIGLAIGSVVLLPAGEFVALSQRTTFDTDSIHNTRWPLEMVVTLIAPNYYGNPATDVPYWGPANYAETAAYFGAVSFLLALTSPLIFRERRALVAGSLALIVLAIVLGSPLARLLFLFPGASFIALRRMLILLPFAGSWLAAVGLEGWIARWHAGGADLSSVTILGLALIIILVIFVGNSIELGDAYRAHQGDILDNAGRSLLFLVAAGAALALGAKWPLAAGSLLLLLALGDLFSWGREYNPVTSTELLYPENAVVDLLSQDETLFRVLPLQAGVVLFGPNVTSVYDLQGIGGYSSLINGRYYELFKAIDDRVTVSWMAPNRNMLVMSAFDPLVSLLNVKYVLSPEPLPLDILPQVNVEGCEKPVPLHQDRPVTAGFVAQDPGLNRVDLSLLPVGTPGESTVEIGLWRQEIGRELVAQHTIDAVEIAAGQPATFFFAPVADSAGQTFVLALFGPETVALCRDGAGRPALAAYATWLQQVDVRGGVWIYENPNVLPRAYVVHHVAQRPADQVLDMLRDPEFNWVRSAVVESPPPGEYVELLAGSLVAGKSGAEITRYSPDQVEVSVGGESAGLLVLSDTYYPGWRVSIDGRETQLLRVNYALRGVYVPKGDHQVRFYFQPTYLKMTLLLSGGGLLLVLILIGRTVVWGREARR